MCKLNASPVRGRIPAERARIVQLLVEVDVSTDGADIRLRTEELTNLIATGAPSSQNPGGRSNDGINSACRGGGLSRDCGCAGRKG